MEDDKVIVQAMLAAMQPAQYPLEQEHKDEARSA
jgi:hypothetical protein